MLMDVHDSKLHDRRNMRAGFFVSQHSKAIFFKQMLEGKRGVACIIIGHFMFANYKWTSNQNFGAIFHYPIYFW